MTISLSNNSARISYTVAQGATQTSFTVPFEFFDDADLNVYVDGTKKTITTHYTVTGGSGSTGSVAISVTGATGGSTVVLTRDIPLARTTDFPTSGPFDVTTLNTELDRFTAQLADQKDENDRSITLQDTDSAASMNLPLKDDRKGKYLAFNATTGAPEAGASTADVALLTTVTTDIATLADIEDGTNATDAIQTVAGVASNVTTVAGIASNVTSVAGNASNINAAVSNATNINTVAGKESEINSVAAKASLLTSDFVSDLNTLAVTDVINDINTLATSDIVSDINTLATSDIVSDLNTIATSDIVSDINTLATSDIVTDLNLLATSDFVADLNTMATSTNTTNLGTVAGAVSNVNTVAGISSDVSAVAGISGDVSAVENIKANVTTVAGVASDVSSVAGIASNVTSVAGNSSNVNTVAGISSNVTTVAGDTANIGTIATDLGGTDTIGTVAGAISNVNTVGSGIANVNTVATNISSVNDFADKYRIGSSDPSSNNDEGDLFYNTTSDTLKIYNGSAWESGVTAGSGFLPLSGGALTGNITMSGSETVDGRDLSADGTKLDGIEASATADQTASEIRTLVESASDSNVFTDADHTKLNGIAANATADDLTALNASNLTSGTIPDARFPATLPALNGSNLTNIPNTDTTYSAGNGLDLSGTTFSIETDLRDGIQYIGRDSNDYVAFHTTVTDFFLDGNHRFRIQNNGKAYLDAEGGGNLRVDLQQGSAKSWVAWRGNSSTMRDNYNTSSITDISNGNFDVNIGNNMNQTYYATGQSSGEQDNGGSYWYLTGFRPQNSGKWACRQAAGGFGDTGGSGLACCIIHGDQA